MEGLRSDGYDVTQAPLQGVRPATLRHDSRSLALAVIGSTYRRERDQ